MIKPMMQPTLVAFAAFSADPALAQTLMNFPPQNGQIVFVMPSRNIGCTFTPAGGTGVYKPADGGPELQCDRVEPKYIRVVLGRNAPAKRFDEVGDASCCGSENEFPYGAQWSHGPYTCDSSEAGLACRHDNGHGFFISRARVDAF